MEIQEAYILAMERNQLNEAAYWRRVLAERLEQLVASIGDTKPNS
jgi:hypothetical protein